MLAVLLLAASVSTQTTSPTFPERPDRQPPFKDAIFSKELLRQIQGRRDRRPKIVGQEEVGFDDIGVATEKLIRNEAKSESQKTETTGQQKAKPNRTIIVHSLADDGPGSLRQALREASDGNKINITVKGTITLTSGELIVDKSVTIRATGAHKLSVSGNGTSRVFHIMPDTVVTISGLTITNGSPSGTFPANSGGGIYNDHAQLTVSSCILSGNSARHGGGIFSNGRNGSATLTVTDSTLSGNTAIIYGGGILSGGDFGSATATLNNITVSNNSGLYGCGIFNAGFAGAARLTISNSIIRGNNATSIFSAGAGIYNNGDSGVATLILTDSTVTANSIPSDVNDGVFGAASGGGIFNDGLSTISPGSASMTIINSTVSEHVIDGLGGGIYNEGSSGNAILTIKNSDLSRNFSIYGGAIYNDGSEGRATLAITESTLNSNQGTNGGGGIFNTGVYGNAVLTITNSSLSRNLSYEMGGAIYNEAAAGLGTVTIDKSNLSGNRTFGQGGGIHNVSADAASLSEEGVNEDGTAIVTVTNSTLSGNSAGHEPPPDFFLPGEGGGIFNESFWGGTSTVNLINSTLSDNSSDNRGGGIQNRAYAEGSATIVINNCTLNGNSANNGGGSLSNWVPPYEGWGPGIATLDIANTILNAGASGGNIQNLSGTVISRGYNLSSDAVGGDGSTDPGGLLNGPGDIRNTNPHLGPLQNNGGPTMTHALLEYSPAIDNGNPNFDPNTFNPPLLYDQRGRRFRRVVNGAVDIGAYELQRAW